MTHVLMKKVILQVKCDIKKYLLKRITVQFHLSASELLMEHEADCQKTRHKIAACSHI